MFKDMLILAVCAFTISLVLGFLLIPVLRKIKAGQTERDDGPQSHQAKTGTPIMGGLIFLIAATLVSLFTFKDQPDAVPVLLLTWGFGAVGFIDDFIKAVLKRSMGLRAWQKMLLQICVALAFVLFLYFKSDYTFEALIPFMGTKTVNIGVFAIPAALFIIVGTVNGSNFTDGVDGLESSVTLWILAFFAAASVLSIKNVTALPVIFIGALAGFLVFNTNKAKVFMGDTGSLALGGLVSGLAFMLHLELYIPIIALIYFAEVLSVILQVLYFKATHGKRIFRMAPIHHHFELGGWSEAKVVYIFSLITAFLSALSLAVLPFWSN